MLFTWKLNKANLKHIFLSIYISIYRSVCLSTGISVSQLTHRDGVRMSTSRAFLVPVLHRSNLHVSVDSHVNKVSTHDRFWGKNWSDLPQMGQIRDSFRSDFSTVQFGADLTHSERKCDIYEEVQSSM